MNPDTAKIIDRLVLSRDGLRKLNIADYAMIREAREAMSDAANALTNYAKTFSVIQEADQVAAPHLYPASGEVGEAVGRMSGLVQIIDSGAIPGISMPVLSGDLKSLLSALSEATERAGRMERERDEPAAPHMLPAPEGVSEAEKRVRERMDEPHKMSGGILWTEVRIDDLDTLLSALSSERERAERAERERDEARAAFILRDGMFSQAEARAQAAEAKVKEAGEIIAPFAKVARHLTQGQYGPAWGFNGAVVEHEDFRAALRWTEEASQGEGE